MNPAVPRASGSGSPRAAAGPGLATLALCLAGALGIWLGLMALRAYVAMVVWNAAEDAPALTMGLIALSVYAAGLLAWIPARFLGGARPAWRFGILLAMLTVARQLLPGELLSPALSFATVIAWLWWLPAFLQEAARSGAARAIAPAVLLGLVVEVAGQTLLHGVDLTLLTGVWSVLGALVMAAAFLLLLRRAPGAGPAGARAEGAAGRGALILGPYLFLQITYLTELGRAQMLTGWSLPAVAILIQGSLLLALLAVAWNPPRLVRIVLGLVAIGLLVPADLAGLRFLALLLIQPGLAVALSAALAAPAGAAEEVAPRPVSGRIYGLTAAGAFLFFVLLFEFYSVYDMPVLWPIAALLVILGGAFASSGAPSPLRFTPALAAVGATALGLVGGLIPAGGGAPAPGPAPKELRLFDYNIHEGFDYYSAPSLQRLAAEIAKADADLVALQEVPRGATLSGGHDLASWLRWRFPQYHLVFGPNAGDMFGNVVMSKYPIKEWGTERYQLVTEAGLTNQGSPPRGLVWALIPTEGGDLLFVSTHLTAYSGYDADRNAQAEALLKLWNRRERTVVAGDFNAGPSDQAIRTLVAGGLVDLPGAKGLGATATYPAVGANERLDYLFGSPDVTVESAAIPESLASDHHPLQATVRLK